MENKPEEENKPVKPRTAADIVGEALLRKIDRVEELESENKALRDQLEACEQHNKILCEQKVESLKEIERLKAEVLKEKFPEN